jgi:hypothetical protein
MKATDLLRVLGDLGDHAPELCDGGLECAPAEVLDHDAAWARLRAFGGAGWLATTGTVFRIDSGSPLPASDERLLQADLHAKGRDETLIVRPAGERYSVRTARRTAGPGLLVTRPYHAVDGGQPLRFQTAWGPGPARAEEGDLGWAPLLTRFVGFGEK